MNVQDVLFFLLRQVGEIEPCHSAVSTLPYSSPQPGHGALDTQTDICNSGNLILHGSVGHLGHVVKKLCLIIRQHGGDVEHSHHHGCNLVALRSHGGLEAIGFAGWVTWMMPPTIAGEGELPPGAPWLAYRPWHAYPYPQNPGRTGLLIAAWACSSPRHMTNLVCFLARNFIPAEAQAGSVTLVEGSFSWNAKGRQII